MKYVVYDTNIASLAVKGHIRIITSSGQLLRDFELDPTRDYQPTGRT